MKAEIRYSLIYLFDNIFNFELQTQNTLNSYFLIKLSWFLF